MTSLGVFANVCKLVVKMNQRVKVPATNPDILSLILEGPIGWKEKNDSYKLFSDFHMTAAATPSTHIHTYDHIHRINIRRMKMYAILWSCCVALTHHVTSGSKAVILNDLHRKEPLCSKCRKSLWKTPRRPCFFEGYHHATISSILPHMSHSPLLPWLRERRKCITCIYELCPWAEVLKERFQLCWIFLKTG